MSPAPVPPRFVPTLTEVVTPGSMLPLPARVTTPKPPAASSEEQLIARIMQRLDMVLERRLRETIGQLVLAQTQTLLPGLRQELEAVVQQAVRQAMEEESRRPTPDRP